MGFHVVLPDYTSHAVPSIFRVDEFGVGGFPNGFDEAAEAVEAGVDVAGVAAGGAVFHGEANVNDSFVVQPDEGAEGFEGVRETDDVGGDGVGAVGSNHSSGPVDVSTEGGEGFGQVGDAMV